MKYLWNKDKTASVKESKIREIAIYPLVYTPGNTRKCFEVYGWYNLNECFIFSQFETEKEAQDFVEALHKDSEV